MVEANLQPSRGGTPEPPYLWASKDALRRIRDDPEAPPATLQTYFGLCWTASDCAKKGQPPPEWFVASQDAIGKRAGLTRQTIGPCLPHLVRMELVDVEERPGFRTSYRFRLLSLLKNQTALLISQEVQILHGRSNGEETGINIGGEEVRTALPSSVNGSEDLIVTEENLSEITTALILSNAFSESVNPEAECKKFLAHQKAKGFPATLSGFFAHWCPPTGQPVEEVHGSVLNYINGNLSQTR